MQEELGRVKGRLEEVMAKWTEKEGAERRDRETIEELSRLLHKREQEMQ